MPNDMHISIAEHLHRCRQETNLTIEQCEELAAALGRDAALMPPGPEKHDLQQLAQGYRDLAALKRLVARKVN
jgi:hypothetical protein